MFDQSRNLDPEALCAFDFETTGLSAGENRAVELGACRVVNGKYEIFQKLVNPGRPIPLEARNVHGISNKMVEDAPKFVDIAQEFFDFVGDRALVAHNSNFDLGYLSVELQRAGLPIPEIPIFDTLRMSRTLHKNNSSHKLDMAYRAFCGNEKIAESHRAGADSRTCFDIAIAAIEEKKDAPSRQIRHHMPWAGGTYQFKDHDLRSLQLGFDMAWYNDIMKVREFVSIVYTDRFDEDVLIFGKPVAFYRDDRGKKQMNVVIDYVDGLSIAIPIEKICNIDV